MDNRGNSDGIVPLSYREKLIQASKHIYFPTWFKAPDDLNGDTEATENTNEEENIPKVIFSESELQKLRRPWKKSLIIQTVDYKKSIPDIEQRLQRIWKLKHKLEIVDIGQGFYIRKFHNPEEYFLALAGGPWFMFHYHLAVQQWVPNFRKQDKQRNKMFIWAQFQNLPVEYFNSEALFKLAEAIGRPIKMDFHTSTIARGRYARVCIEVDTNIPLPPYVRINSLKQEVAYELNAVFCNKCGKIGHFPTRCPIIEVTNNLHPKPADTRKEQHNEWNIIEKRRVRGMSQSVNIVQKKVRHNRDGPPPSTMVHPGSETNNTNTSGKKNHFQWKAKNRDSEVAGKMNKNPFDLLAGIASENNQREEEENDKRTRQAQHNTSGITVDQGQVMEDTWCPMVLDNTGMQDHFNTQVNSVTQAAVSNKAQENVLNQFFFPCKKTSENEKVNDLLEDLRSPHAELLQTHTLELPDNSLSGAETSTVSSTYTNSLHIYNTPTPKKKNLSKNKKTSVKQNHTENGKLANLLHNNPTNNNSGEQPNSELGSPATPHHANEPPDQNDSNPDHPSVQPTQWNSHATISSQNPSTATPGTNVQYPEVSKHTSPISQANLNPLQRLPNNGGETTTDKRSDDPIFPPGFEPVFTFSAKPQKPTQDKLRQTTGSDSSIPRPNTSRPPHNSEPDRVYFPNLPPSCPFVLRNKRIPKNLLRGEPGERASTDRGGKSIPSEDVSTTTNKRTRPGPEPFEIPKRRWELVDKCTNGCPTEPGSPIIHTNEDTSVEL